MKKTVLVVLVILAALIILRAFFMPWANVKASVVKVAEKVTESVKWPLKEVPIAKEVIKDVEKVTGFISELGGIDLKTTVRGYDIPNMVNRRTSKVALSLSEILFRSPKDLDKKSYLVYLLPVFAIVCSGLALMGLKSRWPIIVMSVISGAISIGGFYNLKTANFSNLYVHIVIEKGVWYTMYAYLLIFIIGIIWLISDKKAQ